MWTVIEYTRPGRAREADVVPDAEADAFWDRLAADGARLGRFSRQIASWTEAVKLSEAWLEGVDPNEAGDSKL